MFDDERLDREYVLLFNGITDTIRILERQVRKLENLQARAEEVYLAREEAAARQDAPQLPDVTFIARQELELELELEAPGPEE